MDYKQIPKVELHRHLDCSMRFATLLEIARTLKIEVPPTLAEQKEKFLVTSPMKDLQSVLNKFLVAQKVLHSEEVLTRLAYETVEDAYEEGIKILELRYAPTFIQEGHSHLSFEKIHQALLKGLKLAEKFNLVTGLICIIQRIRPLQIAEQVASFAIENKDSFIALDLADNEEGFDSKPFAPVFTRAKKAGLCITIHSGEINTPQSPWYVKEAIEILGADRIGHGLQIYREPKMIEYVREKKILLELCPTSNWLTQSVTSLKQHPIRQLMKEGVRVSVNTDDPGIFDFDLPHEYRVLHQEHNFSLEEFNRINDDAAQASFINLQAKQRVWPRPI